MNRLRVYVAGPMTVGDYFENIHEGLRVGRQMVIDGLAPYIPHLDAFMFPRGELDSYEVLLDWDFAWVLASDALFRMPGESWGADEEVALATAHDIPVFYKYSELLAWANLVSREVERRV